MGYLEFSFSFLAFYLMVAFFIFTHVSWVEVGVFNSERDAVIFVEARFGIVSEITYES